MVRFFTGLYYRAPNARPNVRDVRQGVIIFILRPIS